MIASRFFLLDALRRHGKATIDWGEFSKVITSLTHKPSLEVENGLFTFSIPSLLKDEEKRGQSLIYGGPTPELQVLFSQAPFMEMQKTALVS